MSAFLLGLAVLLMLAIGLHLAVRADPAKLARVLRYAGATIAGVSGLVFTFTGRMSIGLPLLAAAFWLMGWGMPFGGGRFQFPFGNMGGQTKATGQTSEIRTAYLYLELDHDSGAMSGEVLAGAFAGRDLDDLVLLDLLSLRTEVSGDDESRRLLEAYMDRTFGAEWRQSAGGEETRSNEASQTLSVADAFEILGLQPGASDEEIRRAHRDLMQRVHPDHGGSDYLAARINAAKDLLLSR